jgi:uridylate kinase
MPRCQRILIKLSGQAVAGAHRSGFSADALDHLAREVLRARDLGVQVALVVGGGNVWSSRADRP